MTHVFLAHPPLCLHFNHRVCVYGNVDNERWRIAPFFFFARAQHARSLMVQSSSAPDINCHNVKCINTHAQLSGKYEVIALRPRSGRIMDAVQTRERERAGLWQCPCMKPAQCGSQMSRCANAGQECTHTNTHTLYSHRNTRWGWSGIGHITVSLFSCYVICHQQSLLYPHQMQVAFPNTVPHIFTFSTHTNGLAVYSDVMASPLLWHYWWLNFKLHSRVPSVTYSIALKKKIASTWTSRNITSTDLSWQLWR